MRAYDWSVMPVQSPLHVQFSRLQLHHRPGHHGDHQQNLGGDHQDGDADHGDDEDDTVSVSDITWQQTKLQFHAHL